MGKIISWGAEHYWQSYMRPLCNCNMSKTVTKSTGLGKEFCNPSSSCQRGTALDGSSQLLWQWWPRDSQNKTGEPRWITDTTGEDFYCPLTVGHKYDQCKNLSLCFIMKWKQDTSCRACLPFLVDLIFLTIKGKKVYLLLLWNGFHAADDYWGLVRIHSWSGRRAQLLLCARAKRLISCWLQ